MWRRRFSRRAALTASGGRMDIPIPMIRMRTRTLTSPTATITTTPMDEARLKLAAWLSPAFPVSAYAYSHGIEAAVSEGRVRDAASAEAWVGDVLAHGAARTDAILLAEAWRAATSGDAEAMAEVAELALALAPSKERLLETEGQGAAFAAVSAAAWGGADEPVPYPVAVGRAAAEHGAPLSEALALFLQAFASNLISAAIRLVPLGQTDGQRALAALTPLCLTLAAEAEAATLDDIGGCAILSDIAAMRHETLETRIFRT